MTPGYFWFQHCSEGVFFSHSLSHSYLYPLISLFSSPPFSKLFSVPFSFLSQICLPGSHSLSACLTYKQSQLLQPPPEGPKTNCPSTPLTFCCSIFIVNAARNYSTFTPYPVLLDNFPPEVHVLPKNGPDGMLVTDIRENLSLCLPPEFYFQGRKYGPWHLGEKGRKWCKN